MTGRNDTRMIEDATIALAMYLDENGIDGEEGQGVADRLADELCNTANDRHERMMQVTEA